MYLTYTHTSIQIYKSNTETVYAHKRESMYEYNEEKDSSTTFLWRVPDISYTYRKFYI